MNCKKCGAPLLENDQFCKNCGAAVNEIPAQNSVVVEQPLNSTPVEQAINPASVAQPVNPVAVEQAVTPAPVAQPVNPVTVEQPVNNYANSYNAQPINTPAPKNNNLKFIFIGIGIVIVIAIILVIALGGNKKNVNENGSGDNGGTAVVNKTSTYTVEFKNFKFKVPTNLVYQNSSSALMLGDENDTWVAMIEVANASYNQLVANKNRLQGAFQQIGITASAAEEKNIGGVNFLVSEASKSGQNLLVAYAKANSMYVFGITAASQSNDFDYEILKEISSILASAEYSENANNISGFEKIDINLITGLAQ